MPRLERRIGLTDRQAPSGALLVDARPAVAPEAAAEGVDARALQVERVCKRYPAFWPGPGSPREMRKVTDALDDVSFAVADGETLGVLGANGAGKTTLVKIMTTLIYPSSGRVLLFGRDIARHAKWARSQIGLVTCDERSFYWRLTGRQNLRFFGSLYGLDRRAVRGRTDELLDALGLAHVADRPYQTYSSGMKQKLAIARGLLGHPRIVFYDEPTRSLDPVSAQTIRAWIAERRDASQRQTHVIATNQLAEAEQLCDRVLILRRGRAVAHGSVREIRERFRSTDREIHRITCRGGPQLHGRLESDPAIGLFEVREETSDPGGTTLRLCLAPGGEALSRALERLLTAGAVVVRCEVEETSFNDAFFSLVVEQSNGPPHAEFGALGTS